MRPATGKEPIMSQNLHIQNPLLTCVHRNGRSEIRHKHRSAKEEKDLISRLNRIEGQVRGVKAIVTG